MSTLHALLLLAAAALIEAVASSPRFLTVHEHDNGERLIRGGEKQIIVTIDGTVSSDTTIS